MNNSWLKCTISKGMFRDELAVTIPKKDGNFASAFVPKEFVNGDVDGEGRVKVRVYREGGASWAVLPTEYRDTIPVNESDIVSL